jgi:tRNA(fMet)-specific endonuclease VapC
MATVLVDTDVYSYITSTNPARGAPYLRHLVGHEIALSFVTVGEQYAGYLKAIAKGKWDASQLKKLEARLRLVAIIPYDIEICRTFGELKATIKNPDGTDRTVSPNDLWIAACGRRHQLTLLTNNRAHFDGIPGLNIISEAPLPKAQPSKPPSGS